MALGPGKYDDLCTMVKEQSQAEGVVLIIVGGNKGVGFSAQLTAPQMVSLPLVLRNIADKIEEDYRNGRV